MSWVKETIQDFGRRMGFDASGFDAGDWDERGLVHLELEDGGSMGILTVHVDARPDYLVYRCAPLGHDAAECCLRALQLADFRRGLPWTLHSGAHDGRLTLTARLPESKLSVDALDQAFSTLVRLHREVAR